MKRLVTFLLAIAMVLSMAPWSFVVEAAATTNGAVTVPSETTLAITRQPESAYVASGESVTIDFEAVGEGLTYQWYFRNGGTGVFYVTYTFTGNSYTVTMDSTRDGREIYCVVTDKYGNSVQTDTVSLNIGEPVETTAPTEVTTVPEATTAPVEETSVPGETYPEEELPVLELDVPAQVTINQAYDDVRFQFTPAENGKYIFESAGDMDTACDLYDSEKNWLTGDDDSSDYGNNFKLTCELEAGKTYYFVASFYGDSIGSFTATLTKWSPWPVTGRCGDNLTWALTEDGTLTISGYGDMWYYGSCNTPWYSYVDMIETVVLPDGITVISNYAFQGCLNLKEIDIPEGVTYIGYYAFADCTGLSSVTMSGSITSVDNYIFSNCTSLAQITLPEGFSRISWGMFAGCSALTTITIPGSVISIDEYAFQGCTALTDVYFGGSEGKWKRDVWVSTNDNGALDNATFHFAPAVLVASGNCGDNLTWALMDDGKLTVSGTGEMWNFGWYSAPWNEYRDYIENVTIQEGVTTIGEYAFMHCYNMTQCTIANTVNTIGYYAFWENDQLVEITIPDSVTSIGAEAFSNCDILSKVTIGSGLTSLDSSVFSYCGKLGGIFVSENNTAYSSDSKGVLFNKDKTQLIKAPVTLSGAYVIPASVTQMDAFAFEDCKNLTQITIPDSITQLNDYTFRGCTKLETISIGSGLSYIGWNGVFQDCDSLTGIYVDGANTSFSSDSYGVLFNKDKTELIKAPTKLTGRYDIPGTVTSIRDNAFNNCDALTEVSIPNGVKSIGYNTFSDCDSLTGITIPESVENIESYAFANCDQLTNVYLLADNCSFGYGVFDWSNNVKYNTYDNANYFGTPENPYRMLMSVTAQDITACTIHPDTKVIAGTAFSNCQNLTEIVIPKGVTTIGDSAFQSCSALAKVTVADTVTKIGSYAFRDCDSLTEIVIPEGVTHIGHSTFAQCDSLSKVTLPSSLTSMDNTVFEGCTALTQVVLPEGISDVSWGTFSGCSALTTVTIPGSVTNINPRAFYGCTALTDVYFGGTQDMWEYDVYINTDGNEALDSATFHYADMATIIVNKNAQVRIREAGEKVYYAFTPKESGKYIFTSIHNYGVGGAVYDADMNLLAADNDGDGRLSVSYKMTAGTTYILGTWYNYEGNWGNYTVKLMKVVSAEEATPLVQDQYQTVTISKPGALQYFSFTPAVAGRYTFFAKANQYGDSTQAYVYDADFNLLASGSNYPGFNINCNLEAGKTYILAVCFGWEGRTGSFDVILQKALPFYYMVQNDEAIITGCDEMMEIAQIPETIMGYPVTGINDLGWNVMRFAKEIIIPDSVTMLGYVFSNYGYLPLEKLTLGSGIREIPIGLSYYATNLREIVISENNPYMVCIGGAVYDKAVTKLLYCPPAMEGTLIIPDSVTDLSVLFENWDKYSHLDIQFGAGTDFVVEDGIIYNADKTKIIACSADKTGTYVMPDSVVEIERCAFAYSNLTQVIVSPNVTSIVYGAFMYSRNLKDVQLPENLTAIEMFAFEGCNNLQQATIPAKVESIDYSAYKNCYNLQWVNISDLAAWCDIYFADELANPLYYAGSMTLNGEHIRDLQIPSGINHIGQYAFINGNMVTANIPASVWTISTQAFYGTQLRQVTLAEGLQEIGYRAFESSRLQSVTLPDSLCTMNSNVFANCADLKTAHIGAGLTQISSGAFRNAGLISITLPENIAAVEWNAFQYCESLTKVVFENDAIAIGGGAFYGCPIRELHLGANATISREAFQGTAMATVSMPENITDITYRSFSYCENLISVVIPESVQSIDTYAFEGDYNLHHVLYKGDQAQWDALGIKSPELNSANLHLNAKGNEIAVIDSCTEIQHYCAICDVWETVKKGIPTHNFVDDVCIDCGAVANWEYSILENNTAVIFGYHGDQLDIEIPATIQGATVTQICSYAFYGSDIQSVKIPASVWCINESAFEECYDLHTVTFEVGSQLFTIASNAFAYCESLTGIKIPEGTGEICDRAFYGSGLETAAIANTVTSIGERAFANCYYLGNISLGNSLKHIGMNAFTGCYSLGTVELPESLKILESGAFQDCITLGSLTIPGGIDHLGESVFYGCNLLESVTLPEGIDNIGNQMFDGCESLTQINIPASVTAIGYQAFRSTGLQNVELPEKLTSIDYEAFSYCYDLSEVTMYQNVADVGYFTFGGCAALSNVYYNGTAEQWETIWFEDGNGCLLNATRQYVNALRITRQPQSVAVPVGENAEVSFEVQGEGLTYQWYFKNKGTTKFYPTASFTGNTYSVTMDASRDGRQIYCVVTDKDGNTVTTDTVTLSIGTEVVIDKGICGVNATWKLNDQGVLTISGAGPMADYENCHETPWWVYCLWDSVYAETVSVTEVIIEEGITKIGDCAFEYCETIQKVTLPDTLTEIGEFAFSECYSVDEFILPEGLASIGTCAFQCCESLKQINIPASVVEILDYAFVSCGQLTGIWVDENNANYSNDAYGVLFNKDKTQLILAPGALSGTYTVADGVQQIMPNAFVGCYNLEEVIIPASVTSLSSDAFDGCKVTISEDNAAYTSDKYGALFNKKMTSLLYTPSSLEGTYSIPESVVSIGIAAFSCSSQLTDVIIPDSVITIGRFAFAGCRGLTDITIPDSVTTISDLAFAYCENLQTITIGSGVTRIGQGVFYDCYNLTDVYYRGNAQQWDNIVIGEGNEALLKAEIHYVCDTLGHTFKTYISNGDATCDADGTKTAKCEYCEATDTVADVGSAMGHSFTDYISNGDATCEADGTKTAKCDHCEATDTVADVGSAMGHSFTDYISNNDATTEADGTKTAKCDNCDATDTVVDEGTKLPDNKVKITKQPVSVTVADGKNVVVSFTAEGEGLTYKWYYRNKGAAAFTLTTTFTGNTYNTAMNASRAGRELYCVVTDVYGNSVQTDTVTISMLAENKLEITKQPVNVAAAEGKTATVTFTAKGEGLTYAWYFKNPGTSEFYITYSFTSNTYNVAMNASRDGRQVYCVVTDKYGNSVTTDVVTLSIAKPATITKQPVSVEVADGEQAIISFEAEGDGLTYLWYFKNAGTSEFYPTYSFTGNSYSITMNASRAGRQVYCVITDAYGNSVQTDIVTMDIAASAEPVKITKQPESVTVADGEYVIIRFTAEGEGLTYKWYYKNKGASDFVYTATFVGNSYNTTMNASRAGRQVYCEVTDKYGNSVRTETVTMNIAAAAEPVKITQQPVNVTVADGKNVVVSFAAEGEGLTYKWYYRNKGAAAFTLTTTFTGNAYNTTMNASRAGRELYCVVTDAYGNSVQTDTVTIDMLVESKVEITQQPVSVTVVEGERATVTFTAKGEGLTYQWYFKNKGTSEFFVTNSFTGNSYSLVMDNSRNGRQVYCVVTDKFGNSVTTDTVTLSIEVDNTVDKGTCGENLTWKLDDKGTLTISGTGAMDWIAANSPWQGNTSIVKVVIGEGVTSVGSHAFFNCSELTEVSISNSIAVIGPYAFANCIKLVDVEIGNSVTVIDEAAFSDCDSLTGIVVPDSVTELGMYALAQCDRLERVTLGSGVSKIGTQVFLNDTALQSITVSENNQSFCSKDGALYSKDGKQLIQVPSTISGRFTVPEGTEIIGYFAFSSGCEDVTELALPSSLREIIFTAFPGCSNLTDVYFDGTETEWNAVAIDESNVYLLNANIHFKQSVATIVKQPESVSVAYGEQAVVTVEAVGDGLTYEWYYRNGTTGKFYLTQSFKGNSYSVEMNATRSGRQIYCVVTDQYGNSVQTETVTLRGIK